MKARCVRAPWRRQTFLSVRLSLTVTVNTHALYALHTALTVRSLQRASVPARAMQPASTRWKPLSSVHGTRPKRDTRRFLLSGSSLLRACLCFFCLRTCVMPAHTPKHLTQSAGLPANFSPSQLRGLSSRLAHFCLRPPSLDPEPWRASSSYQRRRVYLRATVVRA